MSHNKALNKYQQRYSALAAGAHTKFADSLENTYRHAVVIPVFNESPACLQRLASLSDPAHNLVIIVANCPEYADSGARHNTQAFIKHCKIHYGKENVTDGVTFGQLNSHLDLLLLDLTEPQPTWLTSRQSGVGYARKVGMDVALSLWQQGIIRSPWLYSTDADVAWPDSYLNFTKPDQKKGALVLAFRHQQSSDNKTLSTAGALYDMSLRYYVLGLRWSGSPWAYHTIGSTLLVHAVSYVETHGFPTREAGEDFYLLNKVAKTGPVTCLNEPSVILSDRRSNRVPFGTGPAVTKIDAQTHPEQEFMLYHPEIFKLLRCWHQALPKLYHANWEDDMLLLPMPLQTALAQLGIAKAMGHCLQNAKTQQQFEQQMWQWFDGFRTLKLVHWLRAHAYPSINFADWKQCLMHQQIPFIDPPGGNGCLQDFHDHLVQIELNTLPFQGGLH